MSARRELFVRFDDGTGRVDRAERDDPAGRQALDKAASVWLSKPGVVSVEVSEPRQRSASERGKGTHR